MRAAARLRRSASATDVPPNFMTIVSGMGAPGYEHGRGSARAARPRRRRGAHGGRGAWAPRARRPGAGRRAGLAPAAAGGPRAAAAAVVLTDPGGGGGAPRARPPASEAGSRFSDGEERREPAPKDLSAAETERRV